MHWLFKNLLLASFCSFKAVPCIVMYEYDVGIYYDNASKVFLGTVIDSVGLDGNINISVSVTEVFKGEVLSIEDIQTPTGECGINVGAGTDMLFFVSPKNYTDQAMGSVGMETTIHEETGSPKNFGQRYIKILRQR